MVWNSIAGIFRGNRLLHDARRKAEGTSSSAADSMEKSPLVPKAAQRSDASPKSQSSTSPDAAMDKIENASSLLSKMRSGFALLKEKIEGIWVNMLIGLFALFRGRKEHSLVKNLKERKQYVEYVTANKENINKVLNELKFYLPDVFKKIKNAEELLEIISDDKKFNTYVKQIFKKQSNEMQEYKDILNGIGNCKALIDRVVNPLYKFNYDGSDGGSSQTIPEDVLEDYSYLLKREIRIVKDGTTKEYKRQEGGYKKLQPITINMQEWKKSQNKREFFIEKCFPNNSEYGQCTSYSDFFKKVVIEDAKANQEGSIPARFLDKDLLCRHNITLWRSALDNVAL